VAEIIPIEYLRRRKRKRRRRRERITPEALMELIGRHAHCVLDQHRPSRCPLAMFTPAMAWELNVFFGVAALRSPTAPCEPPFASLPDEV
jgi:hypothetical protein